MALIILEGLDRTGKSSVAELFKEEGYEVIHMSAPSKKYNEKGYTGPSYADEMIELIQQAAHRDIVLDRSHYGELIWPTIYNRQPLLTDDDIEVLREIEEAVGVRRILMYDPDRETHWARCEANKEPLTKAQFLRANNNYDRMAAKYGFEKTLLTDLPQFKDKFNKPAAPAQPAVAATAKAEALANSEKVMSNTKSREQMRLEKANAINDVLSKRIIKGRGDTYDAIENQVRAFLTKELGTILGAEDKDALTQEEIFILKTMLKKSKENK